MIIVQITGGMGNQLFQYAIGRMLAINNGTKLKLDISAFKTYEWHEYSLKPFAINAVIARERECAIVKNESSSLINRLLRKFLHIKPKVINETNLLFHPELLTFKDSAYVTGYWQSEKYFKRIESQIRKELQIIINPSLPNQLLLKKINLSNSVSLHIRRGNFVQIDFVNKMHGTCSMHYYKDAVEYISKITDNPVFYVFSDDITWAQDNLQLDFETVFVNVNDDKTDYEDLRLMYSCKHNIIANSTFSWWGAWLNPSPTKIVVAPKTWFADEKMNSETADLIPEKWIRI